MKTGNLASAAVLAAATLSFAGAVFSSSGAAAEASDPAISQAILDKATTCQSCHGRDGISASPGTPNLAGQKPDYLAAQLRSFKSGARKNDLMAAIASQLSDEEMKGLAAHWASLPAGGIDTPSSKGVSTLVPNNKMPANFPNGFTVYLARDDADNGTITRNYANDTAIAAARAGKAMPDGAVLFVENLNAKRGADGKPLLDSKGALIADKATSYTSMEAQTGWGADISDLLRNGNWHYANFSADGTMTTQNQAACLACHKPLAGEDYMFTRKALGDFLKGR